MKLSKNHLGKRGEEEALKFLLHKGYKLLEKNFRSFLGEIDLIVTDDGKEVIFVEVRAKTDNVFCEPYETVTKKKQARLYRLAEYYLASRKDYQNLSSRFDVISIILSPEGALAKLEHIENAFGI